MAVTQGYLGYPPPCDGDEMWRGWLTPRAAWGIHPRDDGQPRIEDSKEKKGTGSGDEAESSNRDGGMESQTGIGASMHPTADGQAEKEKDQNRESSEKNDGHEQDAPNEGEKCENEYSRSPSVTTTDMEVPSDAESMEYPPSSEDEGYEGDAGSPPSPMFMRVCMMRGEGGQEDDTPRQGGGGMISIRRGPRLRPRPTDPNQGAAMTRPGAGGTTEGQPGGGESNPKATPCG
jgi:hypothetical protein